MPAMEGCPNCKPWLNKANGQVFLRPEAGKCLHYFIDEELGRCSLRVPARAPLGLQFYCNGHGALACALQREGIDFVQEDNALLAHLRARPGAGAGRRLQPRCAAPAPEARRTLAEPGGRGVRPDRLALEHSRVPSTPRT
jgi:hypothetical protein